MQRRVLVRLLPSFRYIPVNCNPDDTVGDVCKRVARHGYNPNSMQIWFVSEAGRSAPDKEAEAAAWRRGPLDHRLKLSSARIDPGSWLLAEEDVVDAAKAAAPSALALCCSRLSARCAALCGSGLPSTSASTTAAGAKRGGAGGGGTGKDGGAEGAGSSSSSSSSSGSARPPASPPALLRNFCAGLACALLLLLQIFTGGGGGRGGSGSSMDGATIFSLSSASSSSSSSAAAAAAAAAARGGSGLAGRYVGGVLWEDSFSEPTEATTLEFNTYGTLEGGSAAITARIDRAGGGAQPPCYDLAGVKTPTQRLVGLPPCLEVGGLYKATLVGEDGRGGGASLRGGLL